LPSSPDHYHTNVPNAQQFFEMRHELINDLASIDRSQAVTVLRELIPKKFEYVWTWRGVPVIRMPEDLMLQQEIIVSEKFTQIIEIGIARAGGLLFAADMQSIAGIKTPRVIGVDRLIFNHAREALEASGAMDSFVLIEGDSLDSGTLDLVAQELDPNEKSLLILDSSHHEDHVRAELELYGEVLAPGSIVVICDTLIDEMGKGFFPERPWNDGRGPLAAVSSFLRENHERWEQVPYYGRRGFLTGIRDGIIRKL